MLTVHREVAGAVAGVTVEEEKHHLTVRGVGPGRHRFVLGDAHAHV